MFNGADINYVIVILVTGAVLLAAIYHSVLFFHRRTILLDHYSTYLWVSFFYIFLRFLNPSDINTKYLLSFLNPDETFQMLAFGMYIRFMRTAMDLDREKEKYAYNFATQTRYVIPAYILLQIYFVDNGSFGTLYLIAKISIRVYLLILGLFLLLAVILKRKKIYYNYLAAGAIAMIFFGLISSVSNLLDDKHQFFFGALSWLMFGFFTDVIFFSSAIGYRIKTDALEKVNALNTVLQQKESLQQKEIEKIQAVYESKEQERIRISKDLHDEIGSSLSSIQLYSELAGKTILSDQRRTIEILKAIESSSHKAMDEMADIIWAEKPSQDEENNLSSRIKNYGTGLLAVKNINCLYNINPHLDKKLISAEARKNILLIIKEAINNIAKYSRATDASVTINEQEENIMLSVADNGTGFNPETVLKGNGLTNMQNRCRHLEGTFKIISTQNEGTQIICSIPLTKFRE